MQLSKETSLFKKDSIADDIDYAKEHADNYITQINNDGIFVHQADSGRDGDTPTSPTAYGVHISDDVEIIRAGRSIAEYGSTARVGENGSSRFLMNSGSLQAYDANNSKYFEVSSNGISYGTHTVADTAYADQAEADAISTAAADATSKANNAISTAAADATSKANEARKYADNYMKYDSTNGLVIASANPSTATRKVQITSSAVKIQNDANNHADVTSAGLEVVQGGASVAKFGSTVRIGNNGGTNLYIESNSFQFKDGSTVNARIDVANTGGVTLKAREGIKIITNQTDSAFIDIGQGDGTWVWNKGALEVDGRLDCFQPIYSGGSVGSNNGYKLITIGTVSTTGSSIAKGQYGTVSVSANTKPGYTPIGIIGYQITGTNNYDLVPYRMFLNGTDADARLRNVGSTAVTPNVTFHILYIASAQGV